MSALRLLIADDERMARRRLCRLLGAIEGVQVVVELERGDDALLALRSNDSPVDAAVLDIHMPGLTGIEIGAQLEEDSDGMRHIPFLFATAHPDYALEAFDRGAIDYVLKPIEPARLALAIERLRRHVQSQRAQLAPEATFEPAMPHRIAIAVHGEVRLVPISSVSHATLDGALVSLHTDRECFFLESSLQQLLRRLGSSFERVHRRAILSLEHVERLRVMPSGGYLAITHAGHEVPVSRQYARELRKRLGLS